MKLPLRTDLEGFEPYGAPQISVPVILNVNENPYPPDDKVIQDIAAAVAGAAAGANRYPDRDFMDLRGDLAAYLLKESGVVVAPEEIWAGNGSNEIMLHLLLAFGGPGRVALGFDPTYSMYPEYARDTLTTWRTLPRRDDFSIDVEGARDAIAELAPSVVLLASPNNPTGTALDIGEIRAIAETAVGAGPDGADTIVVIDEAYGEFRRESTPSALSLRTEYPHLVVTRTMSKAFGMAGLRLGYLAAHTDIVDVLTVVRLPYHLSAFTQAAARAALGHADSLMAQVASLRSERDALVTWLAENGFQPAPSDSNFVLFGPLPDRRKVWEGLLARGILIREVGPPGHLRVTVGSPNEMAAFRAALLEVT